MDSKQEYYKNILKEYFTKVNKNMIFINNKFDAKDIGKYISALSNTALLTNIPFIFGICQIESYKKITKQDISNFIKKLYIYINNEFSCDIVNYLEKNYFVCKVERPIDTTVQYEGVEYLLKSNKLSTLERFPKEEKTIWKNLTEIQNTDKKYAKKNVSIQDVLDILDYKVFFDLLRIDVPSSDYELANKLEEMGFILEKNTGKYDITRLGALMLAKDLRHFDITRHQFIKYYVYYENKEEVKKYEVYYEGYLKGMKKLLQNIRSTIQSNDSDNSDLKKNYYNDLEEAIREIIMYALVNQDMDIEKYPVITIAEKYIQISYPGEDKLIDDTYSSNPFKLKDDKMFSMLRKINRPRYEVNGYYDIIECLEKCKLPVPSIEIKDNRTKIRLYYNKKFTDFSKKEKINSCYAHVTLMYTKQENANNASLRTRFGLNDSESRKITRIYKEACDQFLIKKVNKDGKIYNNYIPNWVEK